MGNFADPRGRVAVAVNIALRLWGMAPGPICGHFTVEMSGNQGFLVSSFIGKNVSCSSLIFGYTEEVFRKCVGDVKESCW